MRRIAGLFLMMGVGWMSMTSSAQQHVTAEGTQKPMLEVPTATTMREPTLVRASVVAST
jgi:hypothetical protein